jgi:hypothetical protein
MRRKGRPRHYRDRGGVTLCSGGKRSRFPLLTERREEVTCGACLGILERWQQPDPPEAA